MVPWRDTDQNVTGKNNWIYNRLQTTIFNNLTCLKQKAQLNCKVLLPWIQWSTYFCKASCHSPVLFDTGNFSIVSFVFCRHSCKRNILNIILLQIHHSIWGTSGFRAAMTSEVRWQNVEDIFSLLWHNVTFYIYILIHLQHLNSCTTRYYARRFDRCEAPSFVRYKVS